MMLKTKTTGFLSGNLLKLLAAGLMLVDHIGMLFFPRLMILRIIGRLAMPIFAYMVTEGCRYTHSRVKYLAGLFLCMLICQAGYLIGTGDTDLCILATFFLGAVMTFCLQDTKKCLFNTNAGLGKKLLWWSLFAASVLCTRLICRYISIDYGFWGAMLPVFASIFHAPNNAPTALKKLDNKWVHILTFTIGLFLLNRHSYYIQSYCLLSVPLLLLYNERRGRYKMKYFFYIFYPAHLLALYGLYQIIGVIG